MKLKKGSAAAKAFMAKIRAKRKKTTKKVGATKKAAKKVVKRKPVKKVSRVHKDTASHNVRISVVSGVKSEYVKNLMQYIKVLDEKSRILMIAKNNIKLKNNVIMNKDLVKNLNVQIKSLKKNIVAIKKHI